MRRSSRGRIRWSRGPRDPRACTRVRLLAAVALALAPAVVGLASAQPARATTGTSFVSTWQTANVSIGSSAANQIRLPLVSGGVYNFTVDWGDGSSSTITAFDQAEVTHTYATQGTKTLTITGTINGWRFGGEGDRMKLLDISAWGPLRLGNSGGYFWGAGNLQISATDQPVLTGTTNLSSMFLNATALTGATLSGWNITGVTDLSRMFFGAGAFNGDISAWNTAAVTTMASTFRGAASFNRDISDWNVASVTTMSSMFRSATSFNQDLGGVGGWQIGALVDATGMFAGAGLSRTNYDSLLSSWAGQDVKPAVPFDAGTSRYTLGAASTARAVLVDGDGWTITDGGVTTVPNAPTGVNGVRGPTTATITWSAAVANNSAIIDYTVTAVAPAGTSTPAPCVVAATAPRSCQFTGLTNGITYTFSVQARNEVGTSSASGTVSVTPQIDPPSTVAKPVALALDGKARVTWTAPTAGGVAGTYLVTSTPGGRTCTTTVGVDGDPLTCDVTGLTNGTTYTFTVTAGNVGGTAAASAASDPVVPGPVFATTWDTRNTLSGGVDGNSRITLPLLLDGDYDFVVSWGDGAISRITTSDVTEAGVGIRHVYDTPGVKSITITGRIRGWNMKLGVPGASERKKLIGISSWGPLRLGTPTKQGSFFADAENLVVTATDTLDLTGTTSMAGAFSGATLFNGAVATWDMSAVTDTSSMFKNAAAFNQPVAAWSTGAVTTMASMFEGATSFDQPVADWDVRNVTSMASMFAGATSFNRALGWALRTPALTTTASMFSGATAFNQSVAALDLNGVTTTSSMFAGATSFNQPVSGLSTSTVLTMAGMFDGATAFNQDLSAWDFEQVTRFGPILRNTAFGILNYNRLLARLASQNVQPDLGPGTTTADRTITLNPARYSTGTAAANRAELIGRGFTVVDGGVTNQNVPDAPSGVAIGSSSGTSATITWVAPNANNSPITGYTVTAQLRTDAATTVTCTASTTECTFTGTLTGGAADWLFRVTATNAVGTSEPSDVDPPNVPAAPSVVAGNGTVTVTITPPATGGKPATYDVQATDTGGNDVAGRVCTITVPATSCTVSGLANGTAYRFKASASNWVGASDFSDLSAATQPGSVFATTWVTSTTSAGSSGANQVRLPLVSGGTYDFYVSWGDGTTDRITAHDDPEVTHTYAIAGTKEITITGTITGWRFNNLGDRLKLTKVTSWGPLRLGDDGGYFYGAANMAVTAMDPLDLTGTTSLFNAFHGAALFDGDVGGWDTTGVTDLTNAFKGATAFTGTGLGMWNVANVTDMFGAFQDSGMNADIASWDVSRVTDMHRTFAGATAFNRAIGSWDVRQVQDMGGIFAGATSFNQDLSRWNTAAVTDLSDAFRDSGFGGEVATWDVDRVTDFSNMFRNTSGIPTGAAGVGWYNRLLIAWSAQDVRDNTGGSTVVLTACGRSNADGAGCATGALQYSAGAAQRARQRLVDRGWVIADGGQGAVGVPARVSGVTSTPESTAVSWSAPADNGSAILSYAVTAIKKSDLTSTPCGAATTLLYADCGLDAADYHFTVTATNAVGTSEPSFYVRPTAPAAPIVVPGSASAQVVVAAVADAETYTVYAAPAGGGANVDDCTFAPPATSCRIDSLTNGALYRFHAVATNAVGASDASTGVFETPSADRFTSTWETTRTSNGSTGWRQLRLPLPVGEAGDYNFVVTWGDGTSDVVTSHSDPDATHTYATAGTKHISITGTVGGWRFAGAGDRLKLAEVSRWGGLRLGNGGRYFDGAEHLTLTATDAPDLIATTDMSYAFRNATALVDGVAGWNVGNVTTMRGMFQGATSFNGGVGDWNVSNVTNMSGMFHGAAGFNGDVSRWDVSSVTDMSDLFRGSGFTGEVAAWNVANVTTMDGMFRGIPAMSGTPFINWYNRLLTGWAARSLQLQPNVTLTVCGAVAAAPCAGGVQYHGTAAAAARETLVTTKDWTIDDGGAAAANVPDVPGGISYVRNGTELTVSWAAPSDNGSPITGYRVVADPVVADPSHGFCVTATTSCTITGLSPNEAYRYSVTVTATNALGTSDASAPYPMLRPGAPGQPTVVGGDAQATVTVPASTTGGAPSRYVVTASPGGATCAITDLSGPLRCTVTGLANGVAHTFTATADNLGGTSNDSPASASVTPIAPAFPIELGTPVPAEFGFSVPIANHAAGLSAGFAWTASIDSSTGVTTPTISISGGAAVVENLSPGASATVRVRAEQFGYVPAALTATASALLARYQPDIDAATLVRTADGFTVDIANYAEVTGRVWTPTVVPDTGSATINGSGRITVTGLSPAATGTVTVTTTQTGHASGSAGQAGQALGAAYVPVLGTVTQGVSGFTVPITNYADGGAYTWAVSAVPTAPGAVLDPVAGVSAAIDAGTGVVTVGGLAPGGEVTLTVSTTRTEHAPGSAVRTTGALRAAFGTVLGTPVVDRTSFTVEIANHAAGVSGGFAFAASVTTGSGTATIDGAGIVTVTDVAPGASVTVTVTATQTGYVTASTPTSVTMPIGDPYTPELGTATRTPTGFTVQVTNFAGGSAFTWSANAGAAPITATINGSGLVTVGGLAPGASATVTVRTVQFGFVDGSATRTGTALEAALVPVFGSATPTADGFTVPVTNHAAGASAGFAWSAAATSPDGAVAAIDGSGVVTVTNVAPGTSASVVVTTTKADHADGSASASATSITGAALTPTFGPVTRTVNGFTVPIANYAGGSAFTWAEPSTTVGTAALDRTTGLITVTGLDPDTTATVTVGTSRVGYHDGSASRAGTSLKAALVPGFGPVTRTVDGFTVPIANYADGSAFTWAAPTTTTGAVAFDRTAGVITVTGLAAGATATVSIGTTRTDHAPGSETQAGTALDAAWVPAFGPVTRTVDGFTVPIANYADGSAFTWADPSLDLPAPAAIAFDRTAGVITVTGLGAGALATVSIGTTRSGYAPGSASQAGRALEAARVPVFGTVTRTPDGFTVPIANYAGGSAFTWADPTTTVGTAALNRTSGLITVAGVAAGTEATVSIGTTRTDHAPGSASQAGRALEAAWVPAFGAVTRTVDGFTVPIANYADGSAFTWAAPTTTTGAVAFDRTAGVITVTGLAAGAVATVSIGTTRTDHAPGSASQAGAALEAAWVPAFGAVTRTVDGFAVPIANYAAGSAFTWAAPTTTAGAVALDRTAGVITVTGLAAGTSATVSIGTTRADYAPGSASRSGTALEAPLVPTFGAATRTADGFTAPITNYSASYTWTGTATAGGQVAVSAAGIVTVTGVVPDTVAVATVTSRRSGYADGAAAVTGQSLRAALVPQYGATVQTTDGYVTTVANYDPAFTWSVTASCDPDELTLDDAGTITVSGLGPGTPCVLRVQTTRSEHADGLSTLDAQSQTGPSLTPAFAAVATTAGGFTTQVVNHQPAYTWGVSASAGQASIDASGFIAVVGLAPGQSSVVTVSTSRTGYGPGSATVTGSALAPVASVPPPPTAPAAPTLVRLRALDADRLSLQWRESDTGGAGIQRAVAMCRPADGGRWRVVADTDDTIIIGGLRPDTRYRCSVALRNAVGLSLPSKPSFATTLEEDKPKKSKRPRAPKRPSGAGDGR